MMRHCIREREFALHLFFYLLFCRGRAPFVESVTQLLACEPRFVEREVRIVADRHLLGLPAFPIAEAPDLGASRHHLHDEASAV